MSKRLTIYDIKYLHETTHSSSLFFSRSTLKFFKQTLKDFSVKKIDEENYRISAPMYRSGAKYGERVYCGHTSRVFNVKTRELTKETE